MAQRVKDFKGTSFRVPPELLKVFRVKCAERGVSQSAVVNASIRAWIASDQTETPVRVEAPAVTEHRRWHTTLEELLSSGNRLVTDTVQAALTLAKQYLEVSSGATIRYDKTRSR